MRGRGWILATLLLVAAGAAAWILWSAQGAGVEQGGGGTEESNGAGPVGLLPRATRRVETSVPNHSTCVIVGTVARSGKPVAARIEVRERYRAESGTPYSWAGRTVDWRLPPGGFQPRPAAASAAGADGRFVVEGLSLGQYDVVAVTGDGGRGFATASLGYEGQRVVIRVAVPSGQETLRGRAVHADGSPWTGTITVEQGVWGERPVLGLPLVPTAEGGRFLVTGLSAGPAAVSAILDGRFRAAAKSIAIPYAGEFLLVVDAGLVEVSGRVVADRDGSPVSKAQVEAITWGGGGREYAVARATTDAEGKFSVLAGPGHARLSAEAAGFVIGTRTIGEGARDIEVRLVRLARVRGRVVTEGGTPVGNVPVFAVAATGSSSQGARAVSDETGHYELDSVEPGSVMVCAFGGGWISKGLVGASPDGFNALAVDVSPDTTVVVDLVVIRAATARGRVMDAGGAPVPGARVTWSFSDYGAAPVAEFGLLEEASGVATREDGTFLFDALLPDLDYEITADAPEGGWASTGPLRADVSKPIDVEIRLGAALWLDATVIDEDGGAPVGGATVTVLSRDGVHPVDSRSAATGADGRARVGPLPQGGGLEAQASAAGWVEGGWRSLGSGKPRVDLSLTLTLRRGFVIAGHVAYADGGPVSGALVWCRAEGTGQLSAMTDDDGAFRIEGLAPGTFQVSVHVLHDRPRSGPPVSIRAGEEDAHLTVPGGKAARLVMRILDQGGRPVDGDLVLVEEGGRQQNVSFSDGEASLNSPSSTAWISLRCPDVANARPTWGAFVQGPVEAGASAIEIHLPPGRSIDGTVLGSDRKGVRGVRIRAVPTSQPKPLPASDEHHASAISDVEGRFHLGGLWDGEYRLDVAASPDFGPVPPVIVAAGDASVEIVLVSGSTVSALVLDGQERPLVGATLLARRLDAAAGDDRSVYVASDSRGVATLRGLDATADYKLTVDPPEDRLDAQSLIVDPWRPSEAPLRLLRGFVVSGIVRDGDGAPVKRARVSVEGDGGFEADTRAAADGTFTFGHLPQAEVFVTAREPEAQQRGSRLCRVPTGTTDVVLVLEAGQDLTVRLDGWPAGVSGDATLAPEGRFVGTIAAAVGSDGAAKFSGVHADTSYTLVSSPPGELGLCAYREGIRAGMQNVHVPLASAKSVHGRLIVPPGYQNLGVSVRVAGSTWKGRVAEDGQFVLSGLPDGIWTVTAWGEGSGAAARGSAQIAAGGTADIVLKRE